MSLLLHRSPAWDTCRPGYAIFHGPGDDPGTVTRYNRGRGSIIPHGRREVKLFTLDDLRLTADRDADLVEGLRRQEASAIEALIALYGNGIYRLAVRITRNRSDAEEVVQDAFWTAVRRIETFRGDAPFSSWLYRITANCAYTKLRDRRARHQERWTDEGSVMVDGHAPECQDWFA